MLRSLPSAASNDTLYEPNAVFIQFLGSASMTFFFSLHFLVFSSCLALSCLFVLFLSFLLFLFLFRFLVSLSSLFFPFLSLLICSLFLFSKEKIDLRLSCVCAMVDTTCNIYVVVFLGWQAVCSVFPGASNETYAPDMYLAHRRLTPDFTFIRFWWRHELRQL